MNIAPLLECFLESVDVSSHLVLSILAPNQSAIRILIRNRRPLYALRLLFTLLQPCVDTVFSPEFHGTFFVRK